MIDIYNDQNIVARYRRDYWRDLGAPLRSSVVRILEAGDVFIPDPMILETRSPRILEKQR